MSHTIIISSATVIGDNQAIAVHWNDSAEDAFDEVMKSGNTQAFELLRAICGMI